MLTKLFRNLLARTELFVFTFDAVFEIALRGLTSPEKVLSITLRLEPQVLWKWSGI
jgi:hypothetical protein